MLTNLHRMILPVAAAALLSSCAMGVKPSASIPVELTSPVPLPVVPWETTGDIIRENDLRGDALQECNAKLEKIGQLSRPE